jgi:hypothetical protein
VEIEGLDSIHQVLSIKHFMLLANQMKEIFIGKPSLLILASREVNIMFQRLLWNDLN